ncbi:adenosylcobinamide kinase/adenosylcobinamide-phosphate guanylyltransferase [Caldalkalibacillus uzonensis]|uniref:Adenosylcobinamide kinase/adenosylcobinamide-phosphate guanylyltransferase n=1 Tax=Caldalkalibacillus uzonensis TaxID=353224 RepID=A0ABU0CPI9_9BACI|nr:bifunctional adenosylcobinamide kinase/adenosylcobinamide-phosphate guanylyltransferase [Caldalkalibacillus uzonensis]MDQ0338335.1 adenosylcobinamide kinase/adenosylcobinamide-phosphate guanylyltransferase [Caldalkalibacillus uzonensis]
MLVMEGFEEWIKQELEQGRDAEHILSQFNTLLGQVRQSEAQRRQSDENSVVFLIMLEMGRGIVPLSALERTWRDLNGWLVQQGSSLSDHVYYIWHGLGKKLK